MKLGKLNKVDLRAYWKHEALDFTQWLAQPESLSDLADEIGLEIQIELAKTEASVGRFNADILTFEQGSDRKIIIENQLEPTDHAHLGQILTYAAGVEAEYIVWIVKEVKDEHKQAVDWLNEHTDEKVNFFLVRIELWQVDDSKPAPKFMVISRPNNWTKSVRGSVGQQSDLSETRLMQHEFWEQLKEYVNKMKSPLRLRSARPQHWFDIAIGRSDCHVCLTILSSDNKIGCELYIPNGKSLYEEFYSRKEEIEAALGISDLLWQKLPGKKASRIRAFHNFHFDNENREDAFAWLINTAIKFKNTFSNK